MPKKQWATYKLYTYDLWGNARDGWEVNDVYGQGEVDIPYGASNLTINRILKGKGIVWDGEDDGTLYGETKSGKPVAELRFQRMLAE